MGGLCDTGLLFLAKIEHGHPSCKNSISTLVSSRGREEERPWKRDAQGTLAYYTRV